MAGNVVKSLQQDATVTPTVPNPVYLSLTCQWEIDSTSNPTRFPEVSGDSGPSVSGPSLHRGGEEERGRKREGGRERLQPTTTITMSPEAPRLPAPPAAQYSCGSVPDPDQLGSQPCQGATRGECESTSLLPLFIK
ncbi:unnamed protein product [Pleuronectes platessa]|uniref:Uncharacterized protein n=1 Tax=Pleuronectes platessa TaxID=8262 RepID=A0A9N7UYQ5_PLEPL|nr:unnamed protein product [Pleuronectes platessa]